VTKLLKPLEPLTKRAEKLDTYEAYKEMIQQFREMPYDKLYYVFNDVEVALQVLVRREAEGDDVGLQPIISRVVELGKFYLKFPKQQYTYEYIEKQRKEK